MQTKNKEEVPGSSPREIWHHGIDGMKVPIKQIILTRKDIMDYAEQLFRTWASKEGLTPLYIISDLDGTEEPLRLWWFFLGFNPVSPRSGICDEEVIMFFSRSQQFTQAERMIVDSQQNSH